MNSRDSELEPTFISLLPDCEHASAFPLSPGKSLLPGVAVIMYLATARSKEANTDGGAGGGQGEQIYYANASMRSITLFATLKNLSKHGTKNKTAYRKVSIEKYLPPHLSNSRVL